MTATDVAWEKVRRLKPVIVAQREESDRLRRLPDAVAAAFLAEDVYRFMIPKDLGGLEIDPLTMLDLAVEMAFYDASAAWNFSIGASTGLNLGGLPLARLKEIFKDPRCCVAGSGYPPGRAVAAKGGYLLSGRWAWGSAIHQAHWVGGVAIIFDGDQPRLDANGQPTVQVFLMPKDAVTVLDTWFTGGMRGTGSTEWEVSQVFVPDADTCEIFVGKSNHPAPIFKLPGTYFGLLHCAIPLGAARSAIDGLKELAASPGSTLRDQGYAQYAVAKAEALYESSHLYVRESFRAIWDNVVANRPNGPGERARARRSYVHAAEASSAAISLCAEAAGGAVVQESRPFARAVRDVNAVRGHSSISRKYMEMCGQAAFGVPIQNPIF